MSISENRNKKNPMLFACREAIYAGLIAFGLFFIPLGLKTVQGDNGNLVLNTRWWALGLSVLLIACMRFTYLVFILPIKKKYNKKKNAKLQNVKETKTSRLNITPLLIAGAFLFPVISISINGLHGSLKWIDNFGVQILIYIMLAWGLNIIVGLAGILNLGYVAFYAVGAYSYALLSTEFGLSFWTVLPLAAILGAFSGILLSFPLLHLRGDYLAIVTLAFGEITRMILINWREVTNGAFGISGIPKASFFGLFSFSPKNPIETGLLSGFSLHGVHYKIFLYYLILLLCLATAWLTLRMRRTPIGRAWEALKEDEIACRSLGINTTIIKLSAFGIGAMIASVAGTFFAARQGFVSPESFVFMESAIILVIVVLGGMGALQGIAIAAIAMIGGTEILREIGFLKTLFGSDFTPELFRMLLFGASMIIIMSWKPEGFISSRTPTAFLNKKKPNP